MYRCVCVCAQKRHIAVLISATDLGSVCAMPYLDAMPYRKQRAILLCVICIDIYTIRKGIVWISNDCTSLVERKEEDEEGYPGGEKLLTRFPSIRPRPSLAAVTNVLFFPLNQSILISFFVFWQADIFSNPFFFLAS